MKENIFESYLQLLYLTEDISFLDEGIGDFMRKMTRGKIDGVMNSIKNSKTIENLKKSISIIPEVSIDKLENICQKLNSDFKTSYELSKRILTNSLPKQYNKIVAPIACGLAIRSSYDTDDPVKETKKNIKEAVEKIRSMRYDDESGYNIPLIIMLAGVVWGGFKLVKFVIDHYLIISVVLILVMGTLIRVLLDERR